MIHVMHKQLDLLKNFMACFVKPVVLLQIGQSAKKIKLLDVEKVKNHLPRKSIFIGETAKKLISLAPKSCLHVVENFPKKKKHLKLILHVQKPFKLKCL